VPTAIDLLSEAPGPPRFDDAPHGPDAPDGIRATTVHQALSFFPVYRPTGRRLTEDLAELALAHNRTLPDEAPTAVRLKIRTDGAGVRLAKCRNVAGEWELCFASLDPWLADIVEHQPLDPDGPSHWHVTVANTDIVLTWVGGWDDRPDVEGLWLGKPWLRTTLPGATGG